jgi:hypothetical protein
LAAFDKKFASTWSRRLASTFTMTSGSGFITFSRTLQV